MKLLTKYLLALKYANGFQTDFVFGLSLSPISITSLSKSALKIFVIGFILLYYIVFWLERVYCDEYFQLTVYVLMSNVNNYSLAKDWKYFIG